MINKKIPKSVIERIPIYLNYLERIDSQIETISSTIMAQELSLGEVQVRKDLNLIAGNGKPKIGYLVEDLKIKIKSLIKKDEFVNVIIIGAGKIGGALANYEGFIKSGFKIIGIFDTDENKIGEKIGEIVVSSFSSLDEFCKNNLVTTAIISVPHGASQVVCDELVKNGIKGILNFTNKKLVVPKNIKIRNVDISSLLMILAVEINNN